MKNILILTDFSKCANNAVRYAIHFCHQYGFTPVFFHNTYQYFLTEIPAEVTRNAIELSEKEMLKELKKNIQHQYSYLKLPPDKARYLVQSGTHLTENISDIIKKEKIDLLIMGTKGATGLERILFGSNTIKVIDHATCPVISIPASKKFKPFKKIVVFSELENLKPELQDIIPIAQKLKCKIEVCHFNGSYAEPVEKARKMIETQKEKYRFESISLIQLKRNYDRSLVSQIEESVSSLKPDLVCMHTLKYNWFEKIFTFSNTKDLVYHSKMAVLTFSKKYVQAPILL